MFWTYLKHEQLRIGKLMQDVDRRAYHLILAEQDALWVIDQSEQSKAINVCDEDGRGEDEKPRPNYFSARMFTMSDDPLDMTLRCRTNELRDKIRMDLLRFWAPQASKWYLEREAVIFGFVRRLVCQDELLTVR